MVYPSTNSSLYDCVSYTKAEMDASKMIGPTFTPLQECGICRSVTYSAAKARSEDFCQEPFYFGQVEEVLSPGL
ncbi:hypothetical protein CDAR_368711 [Caerostris darwini]|uniref:Uncharacterized protein n=1 Tax=Caerostris darwini TaxID=1538125 RepID=A0AAV4VK21_9ARAC|nr:hypothetical protein CDAR_368711 [Caerostris darwini]